MPPPKAKLHKTSGKARPGPPKVLQTNASNSTSIRPQPSSSSSSSSTNPLTGLTAEQEQRFQTELYWCIQQLQAALSTDKLTNKLIQEHTKALNTLMSNTAPMVKKRQVMRLSCGDYRAKMLEDEKKNTKKLTIKMNASKPSDKSVFLRKAIINNTGSGFQFNFPCPEKDKSEDQPNKETNTMETESVVRKTPNNTFVAKSDNSFKFNFSRDGTQLANDSLTLI